MAAPSHPHPTPFHEVIAGKVRAARARLQLHQDSLAARMRALGYDWHRQTVGNVERGTRRILAEEILPLSLALQTSMSDLIAPAASDQFVELRAGGLLLASTVSDSAGIGAPDGSVTWSDDTPVMPDAALLIAIVPSVAVDYAAEAREAAARGAAHGRTITSEPDVNELLARLAETVPQRLGLDPDQAEQFRAQISPDRFRALLRETRLDDDEETTR